MDRAKQGIDSFKQMKSGDILGGIASTTNTVTGVVSGLASNQGTKLPTSAVNADNTVGKDNLKAAQANNNFYADAGVNFGYTKSSSKTNSHSESAVVTTIKGKDENSSITYNNVKNIEYIGTQAQDTKFIYNNVENINKTAVELKNSYSSSSTSSGISTGVTIGYGDGTQTSVDAVKVSASQSKMNSNGTTYQNGRFVNVDEVHNNTKNMTLSGFNQEGGTVTGNIENLTIESKQNTSITKGRTVGGSLSIAPNGMPSGSANYSQTNGERRVVDNASTFIVGDGSNLKVGKVENTAAAIGTTGNGKLSIDEYVGHDLENVDKLKTVGGSVGVSASGITSLGVNYSDRKQEGITKNTVIGNVEIGKSSGDEINRDLDTMTEITEDRDFKTNINVESQTINYIKNPEKFKEDLQKAKNEIHDIYHAVDSTVNLQGEETRSPIEQLGEVRQAKVIYNLIDSRLQEAENQEDIAKIFEGASEDLGYRVKVIYTDPSNSPQLIGVDKNGNKYIKDGTAYVDEKTGINYILVNTKSPANSTKAGVIGTIAEEQSHIIGKKEGRQKVVPDGSEKGLESLGKPTNDYFKKQYSKNDKAIDLKSDGKDYSNVDFGEHVGDDIHDDMQYEQSLPVAATLNRGAKVIRPDVQKEIEREGYTKVIEKYGKIPYVDSIHKKYGDKYKEEVKLKQLEAEEKTKNSKTEIFYVRIDGINKEVTIESVPKAQGFLRTVSDTIGGLVKNSGEYQSYDYDTRLSKEEKEIKKAKKEKELSKSIYDTLGGLGASRYITEHITEISPGQIEYGTKEEVEERFKLNYDGTQQVVELVGGYLLGKAISKGKTLIRSESKEAENIITNKNNSTYTPVQNEIENVGDTAKTVRKNEQQAQKVKNSVVQNNKNSINSPQGERSQNNLGNKQVSRGEISNKQQGAPVSKTSDVNKLKVSKGSSDPTQKVVSTVSNNNKVGDLTFYAEEDGYEVYYRTMSLENYKKFKETGKIPATGETFISPTQAYSEKYEGVLVKFKVESGTTDELLKIGVRNDSKTLKSEFPDLKPSSKGWTKDKAFFKEEPFDKNTGQINIGLGKGEALDKFNKNIKEYEVIREQEKK